MKKEEPKATIQLPQTEVSQQQSASTRKYIFIMVGVMTAVILVGGFVNYRLFKNYVRKSNEIKAQDSLIRKLKDKQQALVLLQPNYDKIIGPGPNGISDKTLVLRALPVDAEFKTLITIIEKIGQESGVKFGTITNTSSGATPISTTAAAPTTTTTSGGSTSATSATKQLFGFSVNIEAPYDRIIQFLKLTESSTRVINFKSISLSGSAVDTQAIIELETFYQAEANLAPKQEPLK